MSTSRRKRVAACTRTYCRQDEETRIAKQIALLSAVISTASSAHNKPSSTTSVVTSLPLPFQPPQHDVVKSTNCTQRPPGPPARKYRRVDSKQQTSQSQKSPVHTLETPKKKPKILKKLTPTKFHWKRASFSPRIVR